MGEAINASILINIPALTRHTDNIHKNVLGKAIEFLDVRQIYMLYGISRVHARAFLLPFFFSFFLFCELCYHTPIGE